jgi:hypothetical protein
MISILGVYIPEFYDRAREREGEKKRSIYGHIKIVYSF